MTRPIARFGHSSLYDVTDSKGAITLRRAGSAAAFLARAILCPSPI